MWPAGHKNEGREGGGEVSSDQSNLELRGLQGASEC